jgi:hypothetical protein
MFDKKRAHTIVYTLDEVVRAVEDSQSSRTGEYACSARSLTMAIQTATGQDRFAGTVVRPDAWSLD